MGFNTSRNTLIRETHYMDSFTTYETLGITGSVVICASGIPQLIKTWRTKSAGDLSRIYLSTLLAGMVLMQIYSLHTKDMVFIIGNALSMITTFSLFMLCFRYG